MAEAAIPSALDILRRATTTATFDVKDKMRYMEINIVNMNPDTYLLFEKQYFQVGRFSQQPLKVEASKSVTFYVCNADMSPLGVSGGVGYGVYDVKTNKRVPGKMFVATFSHPAIGILKGCCDMADTVEEVWGKMADCHPIMKDMFGLHKKDERSLVFIWKPASKPW